MPRTHHLSAHEIIERDHCGFYIHLGVYVGVNALLAWIDLTHHPERTWFYWPLAGWGLGVLAHAWAVFASPWRLQRLKARQHRREVRHARRHG
jgi:uncharacterized membrane protein